MKVLTIYISGPISGLPDGNRPAFAAAAARLSHDGHTVINPHDLFQEDERLLRWEDYMRVDLAALLTCYQVQLLPGWEHSRGARLEKYVAEQLGMPVVEDTGAA
jgi:hypothetical protein